MLNTPHIKALQHQNMTTVHKEKKKFACNTAYKKALNFYELAKKAEPAINNQQQQYA